MKSIYKIVAVGLMLAGSINTAMAGKPEMVRDTLDPLVELMKIQDHYMSGNHTPPDTLGVGPFGSFSYNVYDYNDDTISSSFSKNFGISSCKNKFIFNMDSIKFVQDEMYNITVYTYDSILHVQRPLNFYQAFLQIDLLDTALHSLQVHQITVFDSASYRWIRFEFKNESPLIELTIQTDVSFYQLRAVDYKLKKEIVQGGISHLPPSSYHDYTRVYIFAYGEAGGILYMSQFDTSKIIKLENGVLVPTSLYQGFELVNELDK